MGQHLDQVVNEYTDIFAQLKRKLKWKVSSNITMMMISSLYVMKDKEFDLQQFLHISEYIKKNVGFLSTLKSSQRFTTAAMLDIRYENPYEQFHNFIEFYEKLVESGFKRGPFTYIATQCIFNESPKEVHAEATIERAMVVYKAMKKEHFFLTGESDYPLAILLAQLEDDIEVLMTEISYYYKNLNESGFRKGNDLQFLSHILSLQKGIDRDMLINRCVHLMADFKQVGRRIKPLYYSVIGLLSLLENGSKEVSNVMNIYDRLNSEKLFKWHKDMNFLMAVNFIVKDKIDDSGLVSTGIQTTIESIIQAQQTAMIATMAGASATASSSN